MKFQNGIITNFDIPGIKFKIELIPITNVFARPGYKMNPEYNTIHNTASPGASAEALSNYVRNQNAYKSWHFTVGNGVVIQHLPITESGWHAGDGPSGSGNRKSIGIEICEVPGAEETAIKFIAALSEATNISVPDKTKPHQHWSGKYCPRLILPHWETFIKNIQEEQKKMSDKMNDIVGRWSEENIKEAVDDGVFQGYPDNTFKPEQPLTREQAAVFYCRIKKIINK